MNVLDKRGKIDFPEVLRRLKIDEMKLKRLISEGEIRAFRDTDGTWWFRTADVENRLLNDDDDSDGEPSSQDTFTDPPADPGALARARHEASIRPTGGCVRQAAVILVVLSLAAGAGVALALGN